MLFKKWLDNTPTNQTAWAEERGSVILPLEADDVKEAALLSVVRMEAETITPKTDRLVQHFWSKELTNIGSGMRKLGDARKEGAKIRNVKSAIQRSILRGGGEKHLKQWLWNQKAGSR
ncbi:hypothetical protein DPX39_010047000 [Trypanosoma brucei equiperdum]|uniref:Uncharacterized protein n=1 Tax=Trypanosoma brucei equiperdum TaxID=630700 RepID=A0A3L6LCT2_9TRYP|nr:hypothetical protein DPX39_010047000 [Trypanosoma brucei equiperdum]